MIRWYLTGIFATLIIVISLPFYTMNRFNELKSNANDIAGDTVAKFVGTEKCRDCHLHEYKLWKNSHHDLAMDIASENSVRGDFENSEFILDGVTSRFYRKDKRFFVFTSGENGEYMEFEITHTFGCTPLQQYLIPFPGGRLQCLPIAWNTEKNEWFHLYPDNSPLPDDWLYWTNQGQNWNGMCAECHSTNLNKNFDIATDSFNTNWSDIDVGCEACHGPGSKHLEWSKLPAMARPKIPNDGLIVQTADLEARELVELCAPCHSRRTALGDYTHAEADLLDSMLPSLLSSGLYYPDGQILDEVYVYGSFTQSKMYQRDISCNDCHDVHSGKRLQEGNDLCHQCHKKSEYSRFEHHHHKKAGEDGKPILDENREILYDVGTGTDCIACHMPGRYYMIVDYRHDHRFQQPRPDFSDSLNVPNACNHCHYKKSNAWSDRKLTAWYGPARKPHYGTIIQAGRDRSIAAQEDLIRISHDVLSPVIVRATMLELLKPYPSDKTRICYETALTDENALIRATSAHMMTIQDPEQVKQVLSPLLYDPVKAVRMAVASRLAGPPSEFLNDQDRTAYDKALKEHINAMEYSGDFGFGRLNLGNLADTLGNTEDAKTHYQTALKISSGTYGAMVNLALIYNREGNNIQAAKLLENALKIQPNIPEIAYYLGLLKIEMKQLEEAIVYLEKASKMMPEYSRIHYNIGLLYQEIGKDIKAETALLKAYSMNELEWDYIYALADFYLKRERTMDLRKIASQMVKVFPEEDLGRKLLKTTNNLHSD